MTDSASEASAGWEAWRRAAAARWTAMLAAAMVVAVVFAAAFEWDRYRRLFQWQDLALGLGPSLVLFWVLAAKTLWMMFPGAALSGMLARRRPRIASLIFRISVPLILAWLAVDLRIYGVTGNHLADYLSNLTQRRAVEYAGDASFVSPPGLAFPLGIAAAALILTATIDRITDRVLLNQDPPRRMRVALGATLLFGVMAIGIIPAQHASSKPDVVARLVETLPAPFFYPSSASSGGDYGRFRAAFDAAANTAYQQSFDRIMPGQPVDPRAHFRRQSPPNVILIVMESLRHDAICPELMPKTYAWSTRGLRLNRHYAETNASHLGVFALLYGRSPAVYDVTLDAGIGPQATETFRGSGYRCSWVISSEVEWLRMNEYLNPRYFDHFVTYSEGPWEERDPKTIAEVRRVIAEGGSRPQFVGVFLMSTHFGFTYPRDYEIHRPVVKDFSWSWPNLPAYKEQLFNRYRNSLAFLDDELDKLLGGLDPQRNLVILTGDHGQSIFDDGTLTHGSKPSDIQTRVPLVMVGPGVTAGVINSATSHRDVLPTVINRLAGRPVAIRGCHGRDLIAAMSPDEAVLFPYRKGEPHQLVLIRGERRLKVKLWMRQPKVEMMGFIDAADRPCIDDEPSPAELAAWQAMLTAELERWKRPIPQS